MVTRITILCENISIHALREEGDQRIEDGVQFTVRFLSTPSARRATRASAQARAVGRIISIHALREEGDIMSGARGVDFSAFLSTPSARRATRLL